MLSNFQRVRTWTPTLGPHVGLLVTHNEAISIADYFTVFDHDRDAAAATASVTAPAPTLDDSAPAAAAENSADISAAVAVYRPTVHYAYYPCDETIASLHEVCVTAGRAKTEQIDAKCKGCFSFIRFRNPHYVVFICMSIASSFFILPYLPTHSHTRSQLSGALESVSPTQVMEGRVLRAEEILVRRNTWATWRHI
jgi:hypothetical protein